MNYRDLCRTAHTRRGVFRGEREKTRIRYGASPRRCGPLASAHRPTGANCGVESITWPVRSTSNDTTLPPVLPPCPCRVVRPRADPRSTGGPTVLPPTGCASTRSLPPAPNISPARSRTPSIVSWPWPTTGGGLRPERRRPSGPRASRTRGTEAIRRRGPESGATDIRRSHRVDPARVGRQPGVRPASVCFRTDRRSASRAGVVPDVDASHPPDA